LPALALESALTRPNELDSDIDSASNDETVEAASAGVASANGGAHGAGHCSSSE
jgi:hypothetical protein